MLYRGLHRKHISDRPDHFVPTDHELLHLVVGAQNAGDEGMIKKSHPTIVDRFLTDKLEDFEYVIRAARTNAGFEEDSIHNPPPCAFPSSSATEFRDQQANAGTSRTSRSAEFTVFAANLGTGWNKYQAGRASDDNTLPRTASADPSVGGTGRNHPRFQSSPWRQGATASGNY